ncbi:LytR family transcriptional regulator [Peptacetobacter hominis]|uniref:LytR family transcriptional regulator n=1 Tax=Peptacetobacter hominis TaxID=2743610 RepID=A0A544QTD9_9FIRM|nr:LCP family protein [Peptacetobacter hominis]TQQ83957.1 LytR family transcriptional regulator [Peptacetobacter hominis]
MSNLRKLVILLLALVLIFPTAVFGYIYFKLKTMQDSSSLSALNSLNYKNDNGITNILLLGTDGRPGETSQRSDAMMILTVDNKNKSLKLTSLGRDTYVDIPGHGKQKLTHAYAYGKADLLIETIEQNFKLDIQNYAQVDFYSFMDIIEVLDGVVVDVQESELNELNKFIDETYSWYDNPNKGEIQYVKKAGRQNLNAYQALSFSRIRKNDGTMERDSRQRQVIEAMISKLKGLPISKYNDLLNSILPYVTTNMSPGTIIGLAKDVLAIGNFDIKSMQFPLHPEYEVRLEKVGYVIPFEEYEVDILHDFIFKDIMPTEELIDNAEKQYGRTKYDEYSGSSSDTESSDYESETEYNTDTSSGSYNDSSDDSSSGSSSDTGSDSSSNDSSDDSSSDSSSDTGSDSSGTETTE